MPPTATLSTTTTHTTVNNIIPDSNNQQPSTLHTYTATLTPLMPISRGKAVHESPDIDEEGIQLARGKHTFQAAINHTQGLVEQARMTLKCLRQGRMLPAIRPSFSGTCIFGAVNPASKASNAPSSIQNNSSHSTPFSISHANNFSLRNNIYELCRIRHSHHSGILAVSETWLGFSVPDAPVYVLGYTNQRHDCLTGQGRGVCFLL